jgi:hypothetical protein
MGGANTGVGKEGCDGLPPLCSRGAFGEVEGSGNAGGWRSLEKVDRYGGAIGEAEGFEDMRFTALCEKVDIACECGKVYYERTLA